jgi:hypothetical protein
MSEEIDEVTDPRLWKKNGWIAKIIKNEDDDGWAVAMTRIGDLEPVLVGPWTMGRDKKNPKPLDTSSFITLVKTANEIMLRHEQSARAALHRTITFADDEGNRVRADLDIARDDDDPHAMLATFVETTSEPIKNGRVSAGFKLTAANVMRWSKSGEG